MSDYDNAVVPYAELQFAGDEGAASAMVSRSGWQAEVLAALISRVIRAHAEGEAAPGRIEPVSVSIDVTGEAKPGERVFFQPRIDRRTRTIIFASGVAMAEGRPALAARAVYRIVATSD